MKRRRGAGGCLPAAGVADRAAGSVRAATSGAALRAFSWPASGKWGRPPRLSGRRPAGARKTAAHARAAPAQRSGTSIA